jgi:hydroxylamine reductase
VEKAHKDTVILTLACDKFSFFDKKLDAISAESRVCWTSASATTPIRRCRSALALANVFNGVVNISEQKAVGHSAASVAPVGIKYIRLGHSLSTLITTNVLPVAAGQL